MLKKAYKNGILVGENNIIFVQKIKTHNSGLIVNEKKTGEKLYEMLSQQQYLIHIENKYPYIVFVSVSNKRRVKRNACVKKIQTENPYYFIICFHILM